MRMWKEIKEIEELGDIKKEVEVDRFFDSRCSLPPSLLRADRMTISGVGSPVQSTGVQKPDLLGWSVGWVSVKY